VCRRKIIQIGIPCLGDLQKHQNNIMQKKTSIKMNKYLPCSIKITCTMRKSKKNIIDLSACCCRCCRYCVHAVVAATGLLLLRSCKAPPKFDYFMQPHQCFRILSAHNLIMRIIKRFLIRISFLVFSSGCRGSGCGCEVWVWVWVWVWKWVPVWVWRWVRVWVWV
jgi:hypothetical protein